MTRPTKRLSNRERFERWLERNHPSIAKRDIISGHYPRLPDGTYESLDLDWMWESWLASSRIRRPARKS